MTTRSDLKRILRRYGNTVVIRSKGRAKTAMAFVQPLRRRHRLYINDRMIPTGYFNNDYKLYIGDSENRIDGTDTVISCVGSEYTVVTSEEFCVGDEEVYVWAILLPKNDLKEDDYDVIDR